MVDTTLQETLPACSATPTTASLTNQWADQLTVLNHQMAVPMQPLHVVSNPPPLHSLPPCSATLTTCQEKPPRQLSPLSSSSSSSSKKMKPPQHSPASRSQFIMVAAEATTLLQAADDLVPGLDERMIMRVDNTRPAPGGPSCSSPAHYNGSSDSSCETTPTAPPTFVPDPAFLSATLVPPSLTSWTPPDLSLPSTSSVHPGPALTSHQC
jgi:hypothetical protein